MMLEELQRRNFSQHTMRYYMHTVEDFARHFNRAPDRLGLQHIREYQAQLFQKRKLSPGTVANCLAALRFFYIKTLKNAWCVAETPIRKRNAFCSRIFQKRSFDGNNRSNRMKFCPAVLCVKDVGSTSSNPMADEVSRKNILAEAFAHAFFDGIWLRSTVAAHWLQDKIALLLL
jgi:hypothetical protein